MFSLPVSHTRITLLCSLPLLLFLATSSLRRPPPGVSPACPPPPSPLTFPPHLAPAFGAGRPARQEYEAFSAGPAFLHKTSPLALLGPPCSIQSGLLGTNRKGTGCSSCHAGRGQIRGWWGSRWLLGQPEQGPGKEETSKRRIGQSGLKVDLS